MLRHRDVPTSTWTCSSISFFGEMQIKLNWNKLITTPSRVTNTPCISQQLWHTITLKGCKYNTKGSNYFTPLSQKNCAMVSFSCASWSSTASACSILPACLSHASRPWFHWEISITLEETNRQMPLKEMCEEKKLPPVHYMTFEKTI